MKVYISVDFEGIAGSTSWPSTNLGNLEHPALAREMSLEAAAACRGALEAGADEVYVKDSHDSGRNLDPALFPKEAKIILGWKGSPESMIAGLDSSFDALLFVGYHSPAGCNGSPLSHTMNTNNNYVKFNGQLASEFLMHAYTASDLGVPTVYVSGDKMLCRHVNAFDPHIVTTAVKEGMGNATINLTPEKAQELIQQDSRQAVLQRGLCHLSLPDSITMEINYKKHCDALRASYYPGVKQIDDYTVSFTSKSIYEIMTARMFIL